MIITTLSVGLFFFVSFELLIAVAVRVFRTDFPWLITKDDVAPIISDEKIERLFSRGFDPDLGWLRVPNSKGLDKLAAGEVEFHIDSKGCRFNTNFDGKASNVAVFGDSFTFCRLVGDDETWPHFLSKELGTNVRNFGVGNYGLDQALIRVERELKELEAEFIVMGVVPETMSRIHSYWKHFYEYGNLLGFKPRFFIKDDGSLSYQPCPVSTQEEFRTYHVKLDEIRALDPFYESKFNHDILGFPYLPKMIRRWRRHLPILFNLSMGRITGHWQAGRRRAFQQVLRDNARHTAYLYGDLNSRQLLTALVRRFADTCRNAGKTPILLVIPQPIDLERMGQGRRDYQDFFSNLDFGLDVVDMTNIFVNDEYSSTLYIEGPLGPHVSAHGNLVIAQTIFGLINNKMS